MLPHRDETLAAADGHGIPLYSWAPDGGPAAVVQVLHGLGEHALRYARFAEAAVGRGLAVVAHDHRGHGEHADERGRFAARAGWARVVADTHAVNDAVRERYPGVPVVMLGHSMGSFVAQAFTMHYGGHLAGLLLSGTTRPSRLLALLGLAAAYAESLRLGDSGHSALLYRIGLGRYNRPFKPVRTDRDWLSRDEAEVDRFVDDPLCGGPYSCSLWQDLARGVLSVGSREAVGRVPGDLPILISGGADDPVGGDRGMGNLAMLYAQTLHSRLSVKIYPGGRHEMLNETNRDEVMADWLDWIAATTRSGRSG